MSNPNLGSCGKRFSSTYQPAKRGRKPSKLKKFLKDHNMGADDIRLICSNLLNKSREELQALAKDPKTPILLAGSAAALLKDMARGSTTALQWLSDRGYGKPPETVTNYVEMGIYQMTPEQQEARIDELLAKREERKRRQAEREEEENDV